MKEKLDAYASARVIRFCVICICITEFEFQFRPFLLKYRILLGICVYT